VEVIRRLKRYHDDTILIYCNGEHETNKKRKPMESIPTTERFDILLNEEWEELRLP
jgi:hypothetical protein